MAMVIELRELIMDGSVKMFTSWGQLFLGILSFYPAILVVVQNDNVLAHTPSYCDESK